MRPGRLPQDHPLEQTARAELQKPSAQAQDKQDQEQERATPQTWTGQAPTRRWQ